MNLLNRVNPARVFTPLSTEDLRRCAPSIFAERPAAGVSARYRFVSTADVIAQLSAEGWLPVRATEQRVRLPEKKGFQMHEVRFARASDLGPVPREVGEVRPEMVLQNAHDGTRAYRIDAGLYRLVCRNGLTVADANFAHVAIRHMDVAADVFTQAAQQVAESTPKLIERIARWREVKLTAAERSVFALLAAELRWDPSDTVMRHLSPEALLKPLRSADVSDDLWTTFNVVQEHLIRGGDRYLTQSASLVVRRHRTLAVAGLMEAQQINKRLWALADTYVKN